MVNSENCYGTKENGRPMNECKACAKDRQFIRLRRDKSILELKLEKIVLQHRLGILDNLINLKTTIKQGKEKCHGSN